MSAASLAATTGAGDAAPVAAATDRDAIGEAPDGETTEQIFLRGERLPLAPGALRLEADAFFSRQDSDGQVFLNGNSSQAAQERTFFTSSLLARYGPFEDAEAFAGLVYSVEDSKVFAGGRNLGIANDADIGDARLGLRQTLAREGPWRPGVALTQEGSAPLKNSSASLGGGLAVVKSYDPAVLFGSVAYRHTFSRDFANVALLKRKERIDASVGYTLALNENLSMSSAVSGAFQFGSSFTARGGNAREPGREGILPRHVRKRAARASATSVPADAASAGQAEDAGQPLLATFYMTGIRPLCTTRKRELRHEE